MISRYSNKEYNEAIQSLKTVKIMDGSRFYYIDKFLLIAFTTGIQFYDIEDRVYYTLEEIWNDLPEDFKTEATFNLDLFK